MNSSKLMRQNDCRFIENGKVVSRICASNLRNSATDYLVEFHYRTEAIPKKVAMAFLKWFNKKVHPIEYDDDVISYPVIVIDGKYQHHNTLTVFTILRLLWESHTTAEKFNIPLITAVAEKEIKTFGEFLIMYEDLTNNSGVYLHGAHTLLSRSSYNKIDSKFSRYDIKPTDLATKIVTSVDNFTRHI